MSAILLSLATFVSTAAGGLFALKFRDRLHLILSFSAGVLLGVVESLGAAFISSPYQNVYGFLLVIAILLVRPTGLFGERGRLV